MAKRSSVISHPPHPYYPLEVEIVGYLANEHSVPMLLGLFGGTVLAIFALTLFIVRWSHPNLRGTEMATILWFVLCGFIHFFFEGYFAINHTRMGPSQTLFGQLWKEYAMSDSRYLTSDPFVLCMESITAIFWGPLSFVVAYMITTSHPLRHPLQALVSIGQIYGDILYYATSMFDHFYKGLSYSRPEAFYFWGYYVLMNIFWIVIPGVLLYNSFSVTAQAFTIAQEVQRKKVGNQHGNGHAVNGRINRPAKKEL